MREYDTFNVTLKTIISEASECVHETANILIKLTESYFNTFFFKQTSSILYARDNSV